MKVKAGIINSVGDGDSYTLASLTNAIRKGYQEFQSSHSVCN